MKYTSTLPTKPGPYWWREKEGANEQLVELFYSVRNAQPPRLGFALRPKFEFKETWEVGGEWCFLVPKNNN